MAANSETGGSSESAVASSIDDFDIISNKTQKAVNILRGITCLLYTSPSPRDLSTSRMPSSA